MDFFTRSEVLPMGVSMVYDARDVPTGEAYVEFTNVDDLQRGMNLHKETMGHRYIEVFRSTRQEAMSVRTLSVLMYMCVRVCACVYVCT
jgi:epithelial splicing regulatory protein 1/2